MDWLLTSGLAGYMGEIAGYNESDHQEESDTKAQSKVATTMVTTSGFIDEEDDEDNEKVWPVGKPGLITYKGEGARHCKLMDSWSSVMYR